MKKLLTAAILIAPLAVACGGRPYQVVKFANPNPFTKAGCKIAVEDLHVDKLMVGDKPVAQYAAEKKDKSAESFDGDLRDSNARFVERLKEGVPGLFMQGGTPDNTFTLRASMTEWEPGFYAYVASHRAEMHIVVDIVDPGGNVLDEIIVTGSQGSGMEGSGSRMRSLATRLGHYVDAYLEDRWLCRPM